MHAQQLTRRSILGSAGLLVGIARFEATPAQDSLPEFVYPLAWPGRTPGDGFYIRHGYACENTWYLPNFWHTGEDWYAVDDADTAGADVVSCSDGEVVFGGSEYPGLVVIVQHADDLFSMYGHLDYALTVTVGDSVLTGQRLGTVLDRSDTVPSHLHFEMRTFLTTPEVNGNAPRYGFSCGYECGPGPGYWPIDDLQHPSEMGWRNPTHVIANRAGLAGQLELAFSRIGGGIWDIWSTAEIERDKIGEAEFDSGELVSLRAIAAGAEDSNGTSAGAYEVWGELADGSGWISLINSSTFETGSDGRASTVELAAVFEVADD